VGWLRDSYEGGRREGQLVVGHKISAGCLAQREKRKEGGKIIISR